MKKVYDIENIGKIKAAQSPRNNNSQHISSPRQCASCHLQFESEMQHDRSECEPSAGAPVRGDSLIKIESNTRRPPPLRVNGTLKSATDENDQNAPHAFTKTKVQNTFEIFPVLMLVSPYT